MDEIQPKKKRKAEHLKAYQYKKGQSGNPGGKPKGTVSLKTWIKNRLLELDDEGKEEFLHGQNKFEIWKMGEGAPDSKLEGDVKLSGTLIELIKHATSDQAGDSAVPGEDQK